MCAVCAPPDLSNKAELEEGGFDFPDRPLSAFVYSLLRRSCALVQRTGSFNKTQLFIVAFPPEAGFDSSEWKRGDSFLSGGSVLKKMK